MTLKLCFYTINELFGIFYTAKNANIERSQNGVCTIANQPQFQFELPSIITSPSTALSVRLQGLTIAYLTLPAVTPGHNIKQGAEERPCAPAFPRGFHLKPAMMDREATNFGLVQTAVEVGRWMIVWKCARQGELSHCYHGQPA